MRDHDGERETEQRKRYQTESFFHDWFLDFHSLGL
jgi:hypothetical protein